MPLSKKDVPANAKADGLFAAKATFAVEIDGAPVIVRKGDIARAGHPVMKGRDDLFKPFEPTVRFEKG